MEYIQLTEENIEKEHICCAISSNKDPQVIAKKEWLRGRIKEGLADTAEPFYELLYLPFTQDAKTPKWKDCAKAVKNDIKGFSLYYTNGCPFTAKYVPIIEQCAVENNIPLTSIKIDSKEKAQSAPFAWTNFALFYDGNYITNEIPNEKKILGIIEQLRGSGK